MKTYFILALFLPFLVGSPSQKKTITYDLKHKDTIIGALTATQIINGDQETYIVKTDISKRVLHIKQCHYDLEVNYKNGQMQSSDYELFINNKLDKSTTIKKNGSGYSAKKNGRAQNINQSNIGFSSAMLYFKEPKGVSNTFSEPNLKSRPLKPHGSKAHTYVLDKKAGEYQYKDGVLEHMTFDELVTIEMVRRN